MFCVRLNLNQLLSPPEVWRLFTHVFILSGLRYWEFLVGSRWWGLADSKRRSFSLAASWFHCDSVAATQTNTLSSSTAFKVQTLLSHWASASCSLKIWTWLEKKGGKKKKVFSTREPLFCFFGESCLRMEDVMTECHFNLWFTQFWFPASKKRERSGIVNFLFSFAFLAFLTIPVSLIGRISLLRYSATSPPFSAGHANHFQGSLYFSFLPVKQRDFPGNVRSGGCDSLPLVVAFTSKQRDSPLSYALRFPHIISHQMCCAGERAESGGAHQTGEKSLHLPDENARKSESFLRGGRQAVKGSNKSALPKEKEKKKTKRTGEPTVHLSQEHERIRLWYVVYVRRRGAPRLPAGAKVQPWTWPEAWLQNHKHMAPVTEWHIGLFNLNTDSLEPLHWVFACLFVFLVIPQK